MRGKFPGNSSSLEGWQQRKESQPRRVKMANRSICLLFMDCIAMASSSASMALMVLTKLLSRIATQTYTGEV